MSPMPIGLNFATAVSNIEVFKHRLMASPCFSNERRSLFAQFNASSAADAFNACADSWPETQGNRWLVWVHEDVYLPGGWDSQFSACVSAALTKWPTLAVVGVYGVERRAGSVSHIGNVLDRGEQLHPDVPLPCLASSLDELLFAVRLDTGLRLEPALGWDFYGTDLVLQARAKGYECAVVNAYCEHWSSTGNTELQPQALIDRIRGSATVFEHKWAHALPVTTTCFQIHKPGDVAAALQRVSQIRE